MASIGSGQTSHSHWRISCPPLLSSALARTRASFADTSDFSLARRVAGGAFVIRSAAALLAFLSQIMLARWLGGYEFGIYVYALTWLLLIGGIVDLGLGTASQRFIPEYTEHKQLALLRGYLRGSRWLALIIATAIAGSAIAIIVLSPLVEPKTSLPLCLACVALPAFALIEVQSGIARSYNWVNLAFLPSYVVRHVMLLVLIGTAYMFGLTTNAVTTMLVTALALWSCTVGQCVVLDRRLDTVIARGPRAYAVRSWLKTSTPISMVEGFTCLAAYTDIIVLTQFRPPQEVAVYYAAAKTLALVAFIHFAVAQTVAHKFTEYQVAGDHKRLNDFLAYSLRLTFWPSLGLILVVLALGAPLLSLFGKDFVTGYYLLFIIAIGLLARAAVGPAERLLNMLGERRACVQAHAGAFLVNLLLCVVLIPRFGAFGAAIASAVTLVFESMCLYLIARIRLGLHCLIFGRLKDH